MKALNSTMSDKQSESERNNNKKTKIFTTANNIKQYIRVRFDPVTNYANLSTLKKLATFHVTIELIY